jgi:hypothetical protein
MAENSYPARTFDPLQTGDLVQRAPNGHNVSLPQMGVDLRCSGPLVPQAYLNVADIRARFRQVAWKRPCARTCGLPCRDVTLETDGYRLTHLMRWPRR